MDQGRRHAHPCGTIWPVGTKLFRISALASAILLGSSGALAGAGPEGASDRPALGADRSDPQEGRAPQSSGSQAASPAELARRLQARYDAITDFSADFVQTYRGGVLRKTTTESGTMAIKKPGRMRWAYTRPEDKLFVADGRKMYIYVPADRQVIVRDMPAGDEAAAPVLFLAGKGQLARDFDAAYAEVPGAPPGSVALKLTPRTPQRDYESITLVVEEQTLRLRMLVARDNQGGTSTFTFRNLKENVGLPDKMFSFVIPRGADVITEG